MKKIIIIHHYDDIGGAGNSLLELYEMLCNDYDVTVYLPHSKSSLAEFLSMNKVELKYFECDVGMISSYSGGPSFYSRTFMKHLFIIPKSLKKLKKIILRENPHIIISNSITLAWVGFLKSKQKIKKVCFIRETLNNSIGMKVLKVILKRNFDLVIFISNFDLKRYNLQTVKSLVVNDSVKISSYRSSFSKTEACELLGIDANRVNILFVGGTSDLKGWNLVSSLISSLSDCKVNFIIAGAVDSSKIINKNNVKYLGLTPNMPLVYKASDFLVFPSTSPHQSRPAFEAGVFSLPVIISDFEETKESVINGINGLTFIPNDVNDFLSKVLLLVNDDILRERLGKENHNHFIIKHEFFTCRDNLLNGLNSILDS